MSQPKPPDLSDALLAAWPAGGRLHLCVACSGGLDSTVLLHALASLRSRVHFDLSALHVHHGLSPRADDWAAHCVRMCRELDVPLRVARVKVEQEGGKGLEAAARAARHAEFAREPADWIVLAHHADDQAETLLHRLIRGTGVAGAAAMRQQEPGRRLWRPLLDWARSDLLSWAEAHSLCWIEDESNADERFFRNFLRHGILPALENRFPATSRNLARAAAHFSEASDLLDEVGAQDWAWVGAPQAGSRVRFRALSAARQRNALRAALRHSGLMAPDAARTVRLCEALAAEGAVRERLADKICCASQDRLWFEAESRALPVPCVWRGEAVLSWGAGVLCFEPDLAGEGIVRPAALFEFRLRAGGERLSLGPGRPRRSVRHLCQEAGIPAWWRDELPLLWRDGELVWVGGVGAESPLPGLRIFWTGPDGLARA
ncbi:tRNA lysidine(34) synthetase TilS [Uliginosibacterium paludis]|uniref:tRNA(Ile)-lysidine synthase n=1 Tax=Uliginosibacterium paludis TaxID=1615952 RepID=A0ABV2CRA1_9RHOO